MSKFLKIGTPVTYNDADHTTRAANVTHIWSARMVNLEFEVITAGTLSKLSPDEAPPEVLPSERRQATSVPHGRSPRTFWSDEDLHYHWTSPRSTAVSANGLFPRATITRLSDGNTFNIVKDGDDYLAYNLLDESTPDFLSTQAAKDVIAWLEDGGGLPI